MSDIREQSAQELLQVYGDVLAELREKGIVRTGNNPIGDFAETLFIRTFGWVSESNSAKGHDAIDDTGARYQIKTRRITNKNRSRELGVLRNLDDVPFDYLAAVLLGERFEITRAIILPISAVNERSAFRAHINGWKFHLNDSVWTHPDARDVTEQLQATARSL
ncbi:MAG: hypothetical protein SGJ23_13260 [Alphaproteobacteria bacterium]|nr:hypothetical protein [Alphaproteobacteria bacterium]